MIRKRFTITLLGLVAWLGLSLGLAHAASIANRDTVAHQLIVRSGENRTEHLLKPAAVLTLDCSRGCVVQVGDDADNPFELEPGDVTLIENGLIYDDRDQQPSKR